MLLAPMRSSAHGALLARPAWCRVEQWMFVRGRVGCGTIVL